MTLVLRRLAVVSCAMLTAACALTNTGDPNTAAVVGDERIPVAEIERSVESITDTDAFQQQAQGNPEQLRSQLQTQLTTAAVLSAVLEEVAENNDIEVTDEQVQQAREEFEAQPGGPEQLEQARQQGITEEQITRQFRDLELQAALQEQVPEGTDLAAFIRGELDDVTVDVNPRFGRFDPTTFQVQPVDPLAPEVGEQVPTPSP